MTVARTRKQGKVRAARLTDLAALGELSRLCQTDDAAARSLGSRTTWTFPGRPAKASPVRFAAQPVT